MRGTDQVQVEAFSYFRLEDRVPEDHPLRPLKAICNQILKEMTKEFDAMYKVGGRPSIPPEQLIRALLLQVLFSVRSERQLMEQVNYNLLFRWFIGLEMDDDVWVPTTFSHNRERLLEKDIANKFFAQVVAHADEQGLLSDDHFTVDGTLLTAWASLKSFKPREQPEAEPSEDGPPSGRNSDVDYRGEKRSNQTHQSTTDAEAMLARKGPGKEARLSFAGHLLSENRHGLIVGALVTQATGTAERDAAKELIGGIAGFRRITVGADKGYDTKEFVGSLRDLKVTPHVAQKKANSAIDGRTTHHEGYAVSQRKRKLVEEPFGWGKTVGTMARVRHRGVQLVNWMFLLNVAAYDLIRIVNLTRAT